MGILNNIKDHFNTAEFAISPSKKIKTICADFKRAFGCSLRIYMNVSCRGRHADDTATLASIRAEGAKGGELRVHSNKTVGAFEKEFAAQWGIGVQVANADDTVLVSDNLTLAAAGKK